MLTDNDVIFERIDEIVELAYVDFTFDLIGADFFTAEQRTQVESLGLIIGRRPLVELLYMLVRMRSTPGYRTDRTLNQLLAEIQETGVLPVINDAHQYSINHAKAQMNEAIETTKTEVKKKVKQEILKVNNDFKNDVAVSRITTLPDLQKRRDDYTNLMLIGIGALSIGLHKNFVKGFTTALTDMVNNSVVDEATTQVAMDELPAKVEVYKRVINDASLCPWCSSFYTEADGQPKIYELSELQANGTNEGKPKSAWLPVVGATHPRCRCQLQYVKS